MRTHSCKPVALVGSSRMSSRPRSNRLVAIGNGLGGRFPWEIVSIIASFVPYPQTKGQKKRKAGQLRRCNDLPELASDFKNYRDIFLNSCAFDSHQSLQPCIDAVAYCDNSPPLYFTWSWLNNITTTRSTDRIFAGRRTRREIFQALFGDCWKRVVFADGRFAQLR